MVGGKEGGSGGEAARTSTLLKIVSGEKRFFEFFEGERVFGGGQTGFLDGTGGEAAHQSWVETRQGRVIVCVCVCPHLVVHSRSSNHEE